MKEYKTRNVAFPIEFLDKVNIEATKTCRTTVLYIQYCIKEFWKLEQEKEQKENRV